MVKMKATYQKKNGHENFVLTPRATSEVTSYQATCLPNLCIMKRLKASLPRILDNNET
jgi:hypothetical protein